MAHVRESTSVRHHERGGDYNPAISGVNSAPVIIGFGAKIYKTVKTREKK
jgi:hypothetical protein